MRELSEKEIEIEYRELKLLDIPDIWDDIEKKLAPKKKKRVIPVGRIATMAAAVAVVILLVPVMAVVHQSGNKSMNDSMNQSSGGVEDESESIMDSENEEAYDQAGESDGNEENSNDNDGANDNKSDSESDGLHETDPVILQLEVEVQKVVERGDRIVITAIVTESEIYLSEKGDSLYEVGDEVGIFYEYDEQGYVREDFSGFLKMICEKEEGDLKLLEIVP